MKNSRQDPFFRSWTILPCSARIVSKERRRLDRQPFNHTDSRSMHQLCPEMFREPLEDNNVFAAQRTLREMAIVVMHTKTGKRNKRLEASCIVSRIKRMDPLNGRSVKRNVRKLRFSFERETREQGSR